MIGMGGRVKGGGGCYPPIWLRSKLKYTASKRNIFLFILGASWPLVSRLSNKWLAGENVINITKLLLRLVNSIQTGGGRV